MSFLERHLEDPVRLSRIRRVLYAGLAVVALAETVLPLVLHGDHPHFWFEKLPAWGSLYGFVSCVAIIIVSKLLGRAWLMRDEGYYDR